MSDRYTDYVHSLPGLVGCTCGDDACPAPAKVRRAMSDLDPVRAIRQVLIAEGWTHPGGDIPDVEATIAHALTASGLPEQVEALQRQCESLAAESVLAVERLTRERDEARDDCTEENRAAIRAGTERDEWKARAFAAEEQRDRLAEGLAYEREYVYEWCRHLGLPLMSPPRLAEAADALGRAARSSTVNEGGPDDRRQT